MKKVAFPAKPAAAADVWVSDRQQAAPPAEPTRRFTFDVPLSLHRRIKAACVQRDENMADVLRRLLEREFPKEELRSDQPPPARLHGAIEPTNGAGEGASGVVRQAQAVSAE